MANSTNLQECNDSLTKLLFTVLSSKLLTSLQASKINYVLCNKTKSSTVFKIMTRNKKNIAVNVETIGIQNDAVRITLKYILSSIDKDLCDIELRLVPIFTYFQMTKWPLA